MILVLSHLFGRRVCKEVDDAEEVERINRSPSIVYLPPMPVAASTILRSHNKNTLDIFATYAKTFAAQHIKKDEQYLPLTHTLVGSGPAHSTKEKPPNGHAIPNGNANRHSDEKDTSIIEFLPSLPAPLARSAFFALSGLGDEFTTIEDLCSSTREGVFLESAVIPHLEIHPEEDISPLNAYLLDFYTHGAVQPLETANGIRKSDVSLPLIPLL